MSKCVSCDEPVEPGEGICKNCEDEMFKKQCYCCLETASTSAEVNGQKYHLCPECNKALEYGMKLLKMARERGLPWVKG